jgi:hypothetical protein
MKKLLFLILIITLPIIAYFEYVSWKRFHPAKDYSYRLSDEIDINYHNHDLVQEYFENALEIGRYAKQKYFNEEIDVEFPDEQNIEAVNASKYYAKLKARTLYLEGLLKESSKLKKEGLSNQEIELIETLGFSIEGLRAYQDSENYVGLKSGTKSKYVWDIQKKLTEKGYEVPIDGLFGVETESQLRAFQRANNLYPSGETDRDTFDRLFDK